MKITILLAAYNRLDLLKNSVRSALDQNYNDYEVLVIDDGSEDETRCWLDEEEAREKKMRVIHQENKGVSSARQKGLIESKGELICILDSDDLLLPGALHKLVSVFMKQPDTEVVYTNNLVRTPDGKVRATNYPRYANNASMIRSILIRPQLPFKHSGTTFRRDAVLAVGGYDTKLSSKIDIELFLRFLENGNKLFLLEDPVVEFFMHRNSISANRVLGIRIWWNIIDRYGPKSYLLCTAYKMIRSFAEILKLIYLKVRIESHSSRNPTIKIL